MAGVRVVRTAAVLAVLLAVLTAVLMARRPLRRACRRLGDEEDDEDEIAELREPLLARQSLISSARIKVGRCGAQRNSGSSGVARGCVECAGAALFCSFSVRWCQWCQCQLVPVVPK